MSIEHHPLCEEKRKKRKKEILEYEEKWPNHCRDCDGVGYFFWYESREPMYDVCDSCMGQCPRCGEKIEDWDEFYDNEDFCPHCGFGKNRWKWQGDSKPPPFECLGCWEPKTREFLDKKLEERENG